MTFSFGIFPLIGIVLAALLFAVYRLWLRMKCQPRFTQRYIKLALAVSLLVTFVHPVRIVQDEWQEVSASVSSYKKEQKAEQDTISRQFIELMQTDLAKQPKSDKDEFLPTRPTKQTHLLLLIYIIGIGCMMCYILVQLFWLLKVRLHNRLMERQDNVYIYESELSTPFSFGHSIFLPTKLDSDTQPFVLLHERSHLRHHHFLWLCLMEILIALQWFNPFAWLLLNELKLQQEMEVDADLMQNGVDREAYQMSLLRVCSNSGRLVLMQTAFGASPLKYRILFMNRSISKRRSLVRIAAAAVLLVAFVGTSFALSYHTTKERNPLDGCWTMDWIRNTNDKFENVPPLYNNLFYGNGLQMNFSWFSRYGGVNMRFNFSGEQMPYRNGVLYNAAGDTLHFNLLNENTHQMQWRIAPNQTTLVSGPDITEQWHRVLPDKDVIRLLRALYTSAEAHSTPISGVWQATDDSVEYQTNYFVVSTNLFFRFTYYNSDQDKYLRRGAGGWCGDFRYIDTNTIFLSDRNASVVWKDKNHIEVTHQRDNGTVDTYSYRRVKSLPDDFILLLTAAIQKE